MTLTCRPITTRQTLLLSMILPLHRRCPLLHWPTSLALTPPHPAVPALAACPRSPHRSASVVGSRTRTTTRHETAAVSPVLLRSKCPLLPCITRPLLRILFCTDGTRRCQTCWPDDWRLLLQLIESSIGTLSMHWSPLRHARCARSHVTPHFERDVQLLSQWTTPALIDHLLTDASRSSHRIRRREAIHQLMTVVPRLPSVQQVDALQRLGSFRAHCV